MVEMAEDIRQTRLKATMKAAIQRRLVVLEQAVLAFRPRRQNEPSLRDIVFGIPEVKEVIVQPATTNVTRSSFDFLNTSLSAFIEQRKADAVTYLGSLVRDQIKLPNSVDPLSLAVGGIFTCTLCDSSWAWPDILGHTCDVRAGYPYSHRDYYAEVAIAYLPGTNWQPTNFSVNVDLLTKIINLYGLNPKKATIEDMDKSPVRLTCVKHNSQHSVQVMTWRDMVSAAALPVTTD